MSESATYQPPRARPATLAIVILLHGTALTALAMAKMDLVKAPGFISTKTYNVPITVPPKEIPPEPQTRQEQRIDLPTPVFERPVPPPPIDIDRNWVPDVPAGPTKAETITELVPPTPPPPPAPVVRTQARLDPGSELKPPYPISEQRAGTEGTVTVRVLVGADGKVKGAEKVRATNDAFFQATLRHALRNWRFRPATLDGRPTESRVVLTLHFQLDGDG